MEPANGMEDPQSERPSGVIKVLRSIGGFCLSNWLIFAFGFAALMAYLFPREHATLLMLMTAAC